MSNPTFLKNLKVTHHIIPAHGNTPNTSIKHKPLLIYHTAFPPTTGSIEIEHHLHTIGEVESQWRRTMYSTSHFHTTSHEVLAVSSGASRLLFGHEDISERVEACVERGDVIVIPAGVAHLLVEDEVGLIWWGSIPRGVVGICAVGDWKRGRRWREFGVWSGSSAIWFMEMWVRCWRFDEVRCRLVALVKGLRSACRITMAGKTGCSGEGR
ncbi:hypothetical protein K470DRAFT_257540 [Piedraia hortae CBS 480.64]|uniref:Cupin type-1 domain-containing protein n=1 Tax=Piedraia hortae CBS 480.64 TaxID=1314780 RepID=A0A6A7C045_9PEZI|nr:hypothetical protein K470DRAFT_257540 [Piedraia hortae CBS 480.64]